MPGTPLVTCHTAATLSPTAACCDACRPCRNSPETHAQQIHHSSKETQTLGSAPRWPAAAAPLGPARLMTLDPPQRPAPAPAPPPPPAAWRPAPPPAAPSRLHTATGESKSRLSSISGVRWRREQLLEFSTFTGANGTPGTPRLRSAAHRAGQRCSEVSLRWFSAPALADQPDRTFDQLIGTPFNRLFARLCTCHGQQLHHRGALLAKLRGRPLPRRRAGP